MNKKKKHNPPIPGRDKITPISLKHGCYFISTRNPSCTTRSNVGRRKAIKKRDSIALFYSAACFSNTFPSFPSHLSSPPLLRPHPPGEKLASCVALGRNFGATFRIPRPRPRPALVQSPKGAEQELGAGGGDAKKAAPKFLPRATKRTQASSNGKKQQIFQGRKNIS